MVQEARHVDHPRAAGIPYSPRHRRVFLGANWKISRGGSGPTIGLTLQIILSMTTLPYVEEL